MKPNRFLGVLILFLFGCSLQSPGEDTAVSSTLPPNNADLLTPSAPDPTDAAVAEPGAPPQAAPQPPRPTVPPAATNVRRSEDASYEFRQWATFDGIPPIYEPTFSQADDVPLEAEELVMGVTLGGEAKAYPVSVLRFRDGDH